MLRYQVKRKDKETARRLKHRAVRPTRMNVAIAPALGSLYADGADIFEGGGVFYGRELSGVTLLGQILHGAPQHLAAPRLGECSNEVNLRRTGYGSDALCYGLFYRLRELGTLLVGLRGLFRDDVSVDDLALVLVLDPDDGSLSDRLVGAYGLLDLTGPKAVPGDVDDVIRAAHHEVIA